MELKAQLLIDSRRLKKVYITVPRFTHRPDRRDPYHGGISDYNRYLQCENAPLFKVSHEQVGIHCRSRFITLTLMAEYE